jgi:hypothetical protein
LPYSIPQAPVVCHSDAQQIADHAAAQTHTPQHKSEQATERDADDPAWRVAAAVLAAFMLRHECLSPYEKYVRPSPHPLGITRECYATKLSSLANAATKPRARRCPAARLPQSLMY